MYLLSIMLLVFFLFSVSHYAYASGSDHSPALMLARSYQQGVDVSLYLMSEKLDGVRAYWDGKTLRSRSGRLINAPSWFLAGFPQTPLDGELWAGRNAFNLVSGLSRKKQPDDEEWQQVRFMAFDLPDMVAPFKERYWVLKTLLAEEASPYIRAVNQRPVASHTELTDALQQMTAAGGEGLMLKRADSFYQASRSQDLLKVKLTQDDEAIVVGHIPGEGKYTGALGALLVRMEDGREFRLGTGFSDAERHMPPPLGSRVSFAFNGFTETGLPRFARFLRLRPEE